MDTLIRIPLETPQSSDEDLPTTYISRKRAGSTDIGGSPKRTRSLDSDEDNWDAFHPPDINYVNEMDDVKLDQTEVTEFPASTGCAGDVAEIYLYPSLVYLSWDIAEIYQGYLICDKTNVSLELYRRYTRDIPIATKEFSFEK